MRIPSENVSNMYMPKQTRRSKYTRRKGKRLGGDLPKNQVIATVQQPIDDNKIVWNNEPTKKDLPIPIPIQAIDQDLQTLGKQMRVGYEMLKKDMQKLELFLEYIYIKCDKIGIKKGFIEYLKNELLPKIPKIGIFTRLPDEKKIYVIQTFIDKKTKELEATPNKGGKTRRKRRRRYTKK